MAARDILQKDDFDKELASSGIETTRAYQGGSGQVSNFQGRLWGRKLGNWERESEGATQTKRLC